jgi:cardiolipin synthase
VETKRRKKRMKITIIVLALFQVMGLVSSIHAILQTRTAQGAIAWVVSLNTISIVAVPAYWVLGRSKFQGYVDARRDSTLDINAQRTEIFESFKHFSVDVLPEFPEYQAIRSLAQTPFLRGNEVNLLVDGEATYDSIYEGIKVAKKYVLFQFYILRADNSGNRFKTQLIQKAAEGVEVYALYDELGSSDLDETWLQDFRQAGIQIIPFNTRQGNHNRFQVNFRNHRKIVVVDGMSAWVGGLNVGDDYLGEDPKLSPWRDTHMRITGPAALLAQSIFWSDWYWANNKVLSGLSWQPQAADGQAEIKTGKEVLILDSGPADELETASLFFTHAINVARKRIWIATPYFIPDEATMVALRLALLKKLDVRILTPALNDNWFVRHAANVYLSELSQLGAKIYFYEKGFMHQKVMLLDDKAAVIGTVNFDNRSFRLNFEVSGVVADREFAGEVEHMLLDDLSNSTEIRNYNLASESLWERFKAHGSALMAPVL